MMRLFTNVFNKKKNKKQLEKSQPPLNQENLGFQIIDEHRMSAIEQEYELKQKSIWQAPQQEKDVEQVEEKQNKIVEFIEYEVKEDDSLFGVALKFSISLDYLMHLNNLSSEIVYTGMKLQIPSSNLPRFSVITQPLGQQDEQKSNVWQAQNEGCVKFPFYYCTQQTSIQGVLTLTRDVIFFDPDPVNDEIEQSQKKLQTKTVKFNTCISMQDINEAVYYVLDNTLKQRDYLIQILLSGIGRPSFESKYRKTLQKFKEMKKSIATVFFRHCDRDIEGKLLTEEKKKENCIFISQYITNNAIAYANQTQTLTKIPFIDLVDDVNLKGAQMMKDEPQMQEMIGDRMGKLWSSLDYVPVLTEDSDCLNASMYRQLIEVVPAVFRLARWYIRFKLDEDGASFRFMLMELKYQAPFILIVKDVNGSVFGAYVSSELKIHHQGFVGNGETFLFSFNESFEISCNKWTEKNHDFTFCDNSGLGIGCGEKFGIFLDQSLEHGYCNPCETFDNPRYTREEKFIIKHLEIWTIQLQ